MFDRDRACAPCSAVRRYAAPRGVAACRVGRLSDDGWVQTVTINLKIEQTPNGSRQVLKSASYNFKEDAENESEEARKKRLDVKR
eukprot:6253918-Prymnesium_polylepis.1